MEHQEGASFPGMRCCSIQPSPRRLGTMSGRERQRPLDFMRCAQAPAVLQVYVNGAAARMHI